MRRMKVSGFTFLRNGQKLGYPFVPSIRSILPLVDEFVIALGQRAIADHVGEHDRGQFTLFAGVAHLLGSWQSF